MLAGCYLFTPSDALPEGYHFPAALVYEVSAAYELVRHEIA